MALIKCEDCKKEYSDKATECPNCGCPTISNTVSEKRKDIQPCSVEIKGDEKFNPPIVRKIILLYIMYISFWIMFFNYIDSSITFLVIAIALNPIVFIIAKKLPNYKKEKRDRELMNEYFQNRFPILTTMPQNYKEIKVVTKVEYEQIATMFEIYMEAYKFNADFIIITNSNISTHVNDSTSKKGLTARNYSKFHITATLIKY